MLTEIIQNIEEYIQYSKDNGATKVELSPETLQELSALPAVKQASATAQAVAEQGSNSASISETPTLQTAGTQFSSAPSESSQPQAEDSPKQFKIDSSLYPNTESGIKDIIRMVSECRICPLAEGRNKTVPGEGSLTPEIMFIGEGPGADEDRTGRPFVGKAGKLLDKMFAKLGITREEIYIGNIVKCRPPNNRKPEPDEMSACLPYLQAQIELLKPKVIVALGGTAVNGLFGGNCRITRQRGNWMEYKGMPVMPTYHPSYLLRAPKKRWETWEDMVAVLEKIGRKIPQ